MSFLPKKAATPKALTAWGGYSAPMSMEFRRLERRRGGRVMGKPRMYGMFAPCVPNSKADMRYRPKVYGKGREIAERDPYESRQQRRERREMERLKGAKA